MSDNYNLLLQLKVTEQCTSIVANTSPPVKYGSEVRISLSYFHRGTVVLVMMNVTLACDYKL